MNPKLMGQLRHALTALGGVAVAYGVMDEETLAQIVGAVVTLVGFIWSWMSPEKQDTSNGPDDAEW